MVDWQIHRLVELADLIEMEHSLQLEDVARAAPTTSGNLPRAHDEQHRIARDGWPYTRFAFIEHYRAFDASVITFWVRL